MRRKLAPAIVLIVSVTAVAQQKRIYIACDDHTDYLWTANVAQYDTAFSAMLDYYLDLADTTAGNAPDYRSRFAADGSFWLWTYERNRTPAQFDRLMGRLADGHISAPMTPLVILWGGAPAEAVLRGMYYAGRLERRYPVRFRLAVSMENQTLPYGLASLWAGSGARYSWKGICGCASQVANPGDRQHDIYWYTGPDGQRVLMKWNTLFDNQSIGGYAEARNIAAAVSLVDSNPTFLARYPFPVIGVFGKGWDDYQTFTDEFVTQAQALTVPPPPAPNPTRRVIVSNELDFFQDFEASHAAGLPTENYSYGNEWELYCASMAEPSAVVKRSVEKLRAAEAMASLVSLFNSTFMSGREPARDLAFMNIGLYWEHDWTGDGPVPRAERAQWQLDISNQIQSYVDALHADARAALGGFLPLPNGTVRFFAFNPLSWARTDYSDVAYSGPTPVHVLDVSTGLETPSQVVNIGGQTYLRVLAPMVPSVGYKVFEIVAGTGQSFGDAATISGGQIENSVYRLTVAGRGAITSLIDKTRGNREFAAIVGGRALNDLGGSGGSVVPENVGPVSVTLRATATLPVQHTTTITLYRDSARIDIRNDITQNFGSTLTWGFGLNLAAPDVRHEEVGALARAKLISAGGDYATRQARYDWLTLNHFADVTGTGGVGITLSNADCYYMKLGSSTHGSLDVSTPLVSVLAGGQVDGTALGIQNQFGATSFMQRFALRTHDAYDPVAAMRVALEHQNPLVCGMVTGTTPRLPGDSFAAVSVSNPAVLLWALKPAEEGIGQGLIARLWNVDDAAQAATIQIAPRKIGSAQRTTHLETDESVEAVAPAGLAGAFARQQLRTFRLRPVCAADIDNNGVVDALDVDAFVAVLLGMPLDPGHVTRSDLNFDGVADGRDIPLEVACLLAP